MNNELSKLKMFIPNCLSADGSRSVMSGALIKALEIIINTRFNNKFKFAPLSRLTIFENYPNDSLSLFNLKIRITTQT
ncbi:MAG: hypothetical protein V4594_14850 [Bacteroidota bacterium]